MNKKGEGEFLFILFFLMIAFLFLVILPDNTNSYKSYMNDCNNLYQEDFMEKDSCYVQSLEEIYNSEEGKWEECYILNKSELKKFCQNKWDGK